MARFIRNKEVCEIFTIHYRALVLSISICCQITGRSRRPARRRRRKVSYSFCFVFFISLFNNIRIFFRMFSCVCGSGRHRIQRTGKVINTLSGIIKIKHISQIANQFSVFLSFFCCTIRTFLLKDFRSFYLSVGCIISFGSQFNAILITLFVCCLVAST